MHEKYITEGIVLGKRGVGEANTLVFILTELQGLVRAKATSARREASKLRYGLEPLSRGRYTFVRGKSEWRLTGADEVSREYISTTTAQRKRLGQVSRLLLRLVQGQEHTPELYKTVREGFMTLAHTEQRAGAAHVGAPGLPARVAGTGPLCRERPVFPRAGAPGGRLPQTPDKADKRVPPSHRVVDEKRSL
ncbi:MAG: hypothetical protein UY71_C0045G0007 [Parcubacteria group bacterium GW2011_GWB1_52_7]|nr:MAG: hypothetical protein UY71_C0045G0007 [Parcubacteria group bacterium GW2011_GWB1_52_7]